MSTSEESLSEIMSGAGGLWRDAPAKAASTGETTAPPAVTAEPQVEAKPEAKAESKADRDESGRFKKAEAESPAEKPQETKPRADVAAIIDERRKRQAAEDRLAELLRSQQKPAEKPSVFENEDAAISSRVDEGNRPLREAIYKLSVKTARTIYKDFGDAEQAFMEAMEQDTRLLQGLRASDDPGEYIYTMGIHVRELADVGGDLMKYRDKVTGSMKAEIETRDARIKALEAELATAKDLKTDLDNVPRSLNSTSSGASPKSGEDDAPELKSIVRFGNKSR